MASSDRLAQALRLKSGYAYATPDDFNWLVGLLNGDEPASSAGGSALYRFAAPIRLTTFDGVNNQSGALTDALTGRASPNLLVRGQHGKHVEIEKSSGGKVAYFYDDGIEIGAPLVGDIEIDGDLDVTGGLTVGLDVAVTGGMTVTGQAEFADDVLIGTGPADTLIIAGGLQAVAITYDDTVGTGAFRLGATNAADPSLLLYDESLDLIATFGPTGAAYQFDLTGNQRVTGSVTVASGTVTVSSGNIDVQGGTAGEIRSGKVIVGAASLSGTEELRVAGESRLEGNLTVTTGGLAVTGSTVLNGAVDIDSGGLDVNSGGVNIDSGGLTVNGGSSTFNTSSSFTDPVTFSDTMSLVGSTFSLNTAYIDFDLGSGAGFVEDNWSGYITAKHDGNTIYIPYLSTAP